MDKPKNNLIYQIKDVPPAVQLFLFSIQQLLAIMAATIAVPSIVGNGLTHSAALFGAGVGTIVYLLFTKNRSPVFLGSSFAFLGSMASAFAGGVSAKLGYVGLIIGAVMAGLVYVIIAVATKIFGTKWIHKLMPAVIIGPTVAIIGLSLAGNAIGDLMGNVKNASGLFDLTTHSATCMICGVITLFVTMISASYSKKLGRLIPFIFGILAGYIVACIFYVIGEATGNADFQVITFDSFKELFSEISVSSFFTVPEFVFWDAKSAIDQLSGSYILTIAVAYIPVAFVVFAEHLADHMNLSTIIGKDLTQDPGLTRTLLGDGIGSMAGALFGGCPNTTYGESIGCVAITKNASVVSIWGAAFLAIAISFLSPFVAFLESIPSCVMGGVCVALYGFIAVSGLKMLQKVDLNKNRNLFVASVILIAGVGGLDIVIKTNSGEIDIRTVACALILGIVSNIILSVKKNNDEDENKEEK